MNIGDWHSVWVSGKHFGFVPDTWARAINVMTSPGWMHPEVVKDTDELLRWESQDFGHTWQLPAEPSTGTTLHQEIQAYVRSSHMDGRLVVGPIDIRILPGWLWDDAPRPGWSVRYTPVGDTLTDTPGTVDKESWTAEQAAAHLGYSGTNPAASARKAMSRLSVPAIHKPGPTGRPRALYPATAVRAAAATRPGQDARTDRAKPTS
ncbi:hypothetical protein AQI95_43940 [Streptomyces yokosukanensis]|uniref:Uncharacterized protein n=1 Tax=Streptomyces yokosukanensis TaxID=67386 RepID=A0A124HC46_9ACTN|nr:hypothetical protein [Streptomyces yokosukanensis]KUM93261.1 hypothetical protein AQI95_43940 [Streptomyces yokosukanensis]